MASKRLSRDEVCAMLRQLRSDGRSVRSNTVACRKPGLWKAAKRWFGSFAAALSAAGVPPEEPATPFIRWTKELALEKLRQRKEEGKRLNKKALAKDDCRLFYAIQRFLGGHQVALRAIGVDSESVRRDRPIWTKGRIIAELKRRHRRREPISPFDLERKYTALSGAMRRQFGSADNAYRAAGIDPAKVRKRPPTIRRSDQEILREIREFHEAWWREHPRDQLPRPSFRQVNEPVASAAKHHFGTFAAAMKAAGLENARFHTRRAKPWTQAQVLDRLRELHAQGVQMSMTGLTNADAAVTAAACKHFGNARKAVEAAGFEYVLLPSGKRTWTPDAILEALRKLHREGTAMSSTAIREKDQSLATTAFKVFGSLRAAVNVAGFAFERKPMPASKPSYWTREIVIRDLKAMHERHEDIRHSVMKKKHQNLFWQAVKLFGNYPTAIREAGIDYWAMSQEQLAIDRARKAQEFAGE
jgi:hypothetical protein